MPAATCSTLYYTIFALLAVAFLLLLLKQNRGAAAALAAVALVSGAGVSVDSGHRPPAAPLRRL